MVRDRISVEMRGLLPGPVQGFISMPNLLQLELRGRIPVVWFPSGRSGRLEGVPSSCPLSSGITCIAPVWGGVLPTVQQQSDPARGHGTLVRRWCASLAIGWSFVAVYQVRMNGEIRQVGGVT